MREVVIVSGCRTAAGSFGGNLKSRAAIQLARISDQMQRKNYSIGFISICSGGSMGKAVPIER